MPSSRKTGENVHFSDDSIESMAPWREMEPDEFAARHFYRIGCFSTDGMTFKDPACEKWAKRFEQIFNDLDMLEACRLQILTEHERAEQEKTIEEILTNGF